jgi:hypothetical protein
MYSDEGKQTAPMKLLESFRLRLAARKQGAMEYDALIDLLHIAEQSCEAMGQPSKVVAFRNLQTVLREDSELSKELQRRMARQLRGTPHLDSQG